MENQNQNPTPKSSFPRAVYVVKKSETPNDNSLFLYKDDEMCRCPYQSKVTEQGSVVVHPCGNFCHFFNLMPKKDAQGTPTDKIEVLLSCGAGLKLPISRLIIESESLDQQQ